MGLDPKPGYPGNRLGKQDTCLARIGARAGLITARTRRDEGGRREVDEDGHSASCSPEATLGSRLKSRHAPKFRRRQAILDWLSLPSIPQIKPRLALVLLQHFALLLPSGSHGNNQGFWRIGGGHLTHRTSFHLSSPLWACPKAQPSER